MCFPRKSRFCLLCLLVSTWLPASHEEDTKHDHMTPTLPSELNSTKITPTKSLPVAAEKKHYFITKLFEKYGHNGIMTFEGFEHLFEHLGIGRMNIPDHSLDDHKLNKSFFSSFHPHHNHSEVNTGNPDEDKHSRDQDHEGHDDHDHDLYDKVKRSSGNLHLHEHNMRQVREVNEGDKDEHDHDPHHDHDHDHDSHHGHDHDHDSNHTTENDDHHHHHDHHHHESNSNKSMCSGPIDLLVAFQMDWHQSITEQMFTYLCPALIYMLDNDCREPCDHEHAGDHSHEHPESEEHTQFDLSKIPPKVWGFSVVAVVIISLVGLLGVAVIPIMQKVFYNHMLQFLVALAVGALSGDALLHLLPHAIGGGHETHNHGSHGDGESGGHSMDGVFKGLCALAGIYFFFVMERILTIITDMKRKKKQKKHKSSSRSAVHRKESDVGAKLAAHTGQRDMDCDEMMMVIHPNKALKQYAKDRHDEHCTVSLDNTRAISHQHGHTHEDEEENESMLKESHTNHANHGGHSHHHCEGKLPSSIAAIAWMVILGDGIHNFSDGLAIGAAFANSLTGGFSTSVAVFCHELPHEIGDFAVLLRAGMSAKQAIFYNCVSSVLCFLGMVVGVMIGNLSSASLWIFAIIGGVFLYIALVDMLPEMTSVDTKKGENPFYHLLFQCVGMLVGAGIMLTIALYEENLHNMFEV